MLCTACLAAGCSRDGSNPYAPSGVARGAEAIDGLTVGHRLMEAGEFDLALKAYYRAAVEHGTTVDVLSAIGSADLRLGRLGQAEQMLRRAIDADERFVPAWNNLGVVLMEKNELSEAAQVFRTAYALDSGNSDEIRENLRLALAKMDAPRYDPQEEPAEYKLVRRGYGEYLLLGAAKGNAQ
ncbi:tetratricopeptide repeat protein [Frigidibacter sp. MR17.14]|uniref:tetratricopeptide repeat protein n=1 Tax=Frigidibacter sp. MR17.14 TaxID=3126509 RepID=UPI003012D412